jgi:hypothetical protein
MNGRLTWLCGSAWLAFAIGLLAVPEVGANGLRGSRSGGRGPRRPRVAATWRASRTPGLPRAATTGRSAMGTVKPPRAAIASSRTAARTTLSPGVYAYGSAASTRRYQAYGYGRGYHNRFRGGLYGYGRSQGNNRAIIARLRSVHASLARIDRDYQGHRVRAMHAIAMAIQQLSHRSMFSRRMGVLPAANIDMGLGMGRGRAGAGARRAQPMTQAQSDAVLGRDLRTLHGIGTQLGTQGYYTGGHNRALGHIRRAIHELNVALSIR